MNPPKTLRECQKCGQPFLIRDAPATESTSLKQTVIGKQNSPDEYFLPSPQTEMPKIEAPILTAKEAEGPSIGQSVCSYCQYPVGSNTEECPKCGERLLRSATASPNAEVQPLILAEINQPEPLTTGKVGVEKPAIIKGTIDPYTQGSKMSSELTLIPIARQDERSSTPPVATFDSDTLASIPVLLHRSLLDPENRTISGTAQAQLDFVEGQWFIVDKSSLQTTFVLVNQPYGLSDGDILLMGDRKFEVRIKELPIGG
jgi:hypothetical protein